MRRIKYTKQPYLHVHKWIVTVSRQKAKTKTAKAHWHTQFHYCVNRLEVRDLLKRMPKGRIVEVYAATHDFREAWQS